MVVFNLQDLIYEICCDLVLDSSIDIIDCILIKFASVPLDLYDVSIVEYIYIFCLQWLQCMQNENIKESETIKNWHGGLRLLYRAMQSQRDESESNIPIATQEVKDAAKENLKNLLVHQNVPQLYKLSDKLNRHDH